MQHESRVSYHQPSPLSPLSHPESSRLEPCQRIESSTQMLLLGQVRRRRSNKLAKKNVSKRYSAALATVEDPSGIVDTSLADSSEAKNKELMAKTAKSHTVWKQIDGHATPTRNHSQLIHPRGSWSDNAEASRQALSPARTQCRLQNVRIPPAIQMT